MRPSRSGNATIRAFTSPRDRTAETTRTFRGSAGSSPARPANTTSGRSSRCRTPGGTPHIHVKVKKGGKELLTTQLFINGYPQNKTDGVFGGLRDPLERELVLVDFKPFKDSKIGELAARFDVVVGLTPAEPREDRRR